MSVRVFFVEDQPVVRLGLEALLANTDVKIAATAATGSEAVKKVGSVHADLILLDVRIADGDGFTTLARIKAERPDLPVLMFSAHENPTYVARAVALGAAGYTLKGASKEDLLIAIHRAAAGETHWTREDLSPRDQRSGCPADNARCRCGTDPPRAGSAQAPGSRRYQ